LADYPSRRSKRGEIDKFITQSNKLAIPADKRARLLFAIDATASRQPTWNKACELQGRMFMATRELGGLAVQLCYYRGFNELRASKWLVDEAALLRQMSQVRCEGGLTQIERVLNHGLREHGATAVKALVYIGDAVEESVDLLCGKAGECGLQKLPLFMFQEGTDTTVKQCYQTMARLSGGAYAHFDHNSPGQLADLLGAVASYAAAGEQGLLRYSSEQGTSGKLLLEQLKQDY
jgi:hypothetical protein